MSVGIEYYENHCANDKKGSEQRQRTLLAKPLREYGNLENFKRLFYLDDVAVYPKQGSNKKNNGLMGLVKVKVENGNIVADSFNAEHHDIRNPLPAGQKSRLSKIQPPSKDSNGVLFQYAALNDAGLNTKPNVMGLSIKCFKNAIKAKITAESAYYLMTDKVYTIKVKDGNRLIDITGDFGGLDYIDAKESKEFISRLSFFPSNLTSPDSKIRIQAATQNDEGVYESLSDEFDVINDEIQLPIEGFLYTSIPADYQHLKNDYDTATIYMTQGDYDDLSKVYLGRENGQNVNTPIVHPVVYKTDYFDSFYPSGSWITDRKATSQGNIRFYHFDNNQGKINCYFEKRYDIPSAYIEFSVGVMKYISGTEPIEGYPYVAKIRAIFMYVNNPTTIDLEATLRLYDNNNTAVSNGIQWYGGGGVEKAINLRLNANGTIVGQTEFYFKKTTTSVRKMKMDGSPQQYDTGNRPYSIQYGNYMMITD